MFYLNYKKIIKSKKLRLKILRLLSFLPDTLMIKLQFRIYTGRRLNLKRPITFNEKIQWYKLYYRDPLMIICADKYKVREYVKNMGLSTILNDCYKVYDSVNDINFDELPDKFVLKTTNGSGTNYFCENKESLQKKEVIGLLKDWMKPFKKSPGREWGYDSIVPRIICEKFLEVNHDEGEDLRDYKFFCFNGQPRYIQVDMYRSTAHKRNIYDINWNYIDQTITYPNVGDVLERPPNLEKMIEISTVLSSNFPHVRVDLYDYRGKVIFGELTFYHGSGYEKFSSYQFEKEMGDHFILPNKLSF